MKRLSTSLIALLVALAVTAAPVPAAAERPGWRERFEVDGDLRLRYEIIDAAPAPELDRGRVRARLNVSAAATDELRVVFRLATNDGSPVSDNLTLGRGFSGDDLDLVRAYVDWRPNGWFRLRGGRMPLPWHRSGGNSLLWDSDFDPEGGAALLDGERLFGSLALVSVADRPGDGDSLLTAAQGGLRFTGRGEAGVTAGFGYYDYGNTAGHPPLYDGRPHGNAVDAAGNLLYDYSLIELFADYATSLGERPLTVFAEWVRNTEVDVADTAWAVGAALGSASAPGRFEMSYAWHDTEADAVIGTFNDSDFAGGMTDSRGHFVAGDYRMTEHLSLGATFIVSERGLRAGDKRDFDRLMLDVEWSFE